MLAGLLGRQRAMRRDRDAPGAAGLAVLNQIGLSHRAEHAHTKTGQLIVPQKVIAPLWCWGRVDNALR